MGSGLKSCIKCSKSDGNTLVCIGVDCPIVLHEKCMGIPPCLDASGKFECPYCSTQKAYKEMNQMWEDVVFTKRALSLFLHQVPPEQKEKERVISPEGEGVVVVEKARERESERERKGKFVAVDDQEQEQEQERERKIKFVVVVDSESEEDSDDFETGREVNGSFLHEKKGGSEGNSLGTGRGVVDVTDIGVTGGVDVVNSKGPISVTQNEHKMKTNCIKLSTTSRPSSSNVGPSKVNRPSDLPSPNVASSRKSLPIIRKGPWNTKKKKKKTDTPGKVSQKVSKPVARKRLLWTNEEIDMIKKGVERHAAKDNKNISWMSILNDGRHVFKDSRKPENLKDKWRKMLDREKLAAKVNVTP